jgi:hypothetical protein
LNEAEYRKYVLGQPASCGEDVINLPTGLAAEPVAFGVFELFPVPAADHVVLVGALPDGARLRLVDALGREVRVWRAAGGRSELDVSGLAPGLHFLLLPDARHTVLRLVKQ